MAEELLWWARETHPPYETVWMWDGLNGWYAKPADGYQELRSSSLKPNLMNSIYCRISNPRLAYQVAQGQASLTDILLS